MEREGLAEGNDGNKSGLPAGIIIIAERSSDLGISAAARTKRAGAGPGRDGGSRINCRPISAGVLGECSGGPGQMSEPGRNGLGRKEWADPSRGRIKPADTLA